MATSNKTSPGAHAPAPQAPAAPAGIAPATEQLRQLKLNLQATREKLMLVSPDLLNDADHEAWGEQIFKVSVAINGLRNATLQALSDEFKAELPKFESAATKLTDELFQLQQAVDVIKAVSAALGVISKIVTLLG